MDLDRAFLVVCITVFAVVAINVGIYLSVRRGDDVNTINMFRKAARRARDPWKDEDDALTELSNLVERFKDKTPKRENSDENHIEQEK
jgi:hypothetical protein